MQRHVIDQTRDRDDTLRTREFVRLQKESAQHYSYKLLHRKLHRERGSGQFQAYLNIEKGREA